MKTRSAHTRILALLLCFSMLLSFAPAIQLFSAAHAAEGTGCCDADHTTFTLVGDGQAPPPQAALLIRTSKPPAASTSPNIPRMDSVLERSHLM